MENYTCFSDENLQELAVSGDRLAEETLAQRYSRLVRICSRPYFLAGGDSEDLIQEGTLGLLSAIREYDGKQSVSFRSYAELCIRRRIFSAIKSANRLKHTPLNYGISLEDAFSERETAWIILEQKRAPEEQVLARESAKEFFQSFSRCLSSFEKTVLDLYLDGYSYQAMAEHCGREVKSIDNAVQRIRQKLARILQSGDIGES